jgi:MFS superfamily sulfate permease-like transporter
MAGAQTKISAISHGVLLLISVMFFPALLNYIPLSTLSVILIFTGYKLAKPAVFKQVYSKGLDSFIPFIVTIIAIVFSDLLKGIAIGMLIAMMYVFKNNMHQPMLFTQNNNNYLIRFIKDVSFFNKAALRKYLASVPKNSKLIIDLRKPVFIDDDIIEIINEYKTTADTLQIHLEILQDNHQNFNTTTTII